MTEGGVPTVFTIHNIAYRGLFSTGVFPDLALPAEFFSIDGVELLTGRCLFIEGWIVLRGPANHGQPDLCLRNPDPGFRLGA